MITTNVNPFTGEVLTGNSVGSFLRKAAFPVAMVAAAPLAIAMGNRQSKKELPSIRAEAKRKAKIYAKMPKRPKGGFTVKQASKKYE